MRHGFTTGSCAAAAAKAATYMLLSGKEKNSITIDTPGGISYTAEILDIQRKADSVNCAVKKDGGDDPDVTSGLLIFATVSFADDVNAKDEGSSGCKNTGASSGMVIIEGGEGIGKVTKPGLDQPVGEAAINSVPREMITKEVLSVCRIFE